MSAKAAPKTLHQVRNVAYIFAAWAGLQKGFAEKSANDKLWVEYQNQVRKQNVESQHAAVALQEMKRDAELESTLPAMLPKELHDLAKVFEK